MADFATTQDVIDLWRDLTAQEMTRASELLPEIGRASCRERV